MPTKSAKKTTPRDEELRRDAKQKRERGEELARTREWWRQAKIDNLMSIVVQSLKVHGHNYSMESIFLIRNLAKGASYAPERGASFIRKELAHWKLQKNSRYLLKHRFILLPSTTCVSTVSEMHTAMRHMNSSLQEWQVNQSSLVYEMKGSRNYVSNTWVRCEIVAVYFEIFTCLFEEVGIREESSSAKEPHSKQLLDFAHDIMVEHGRTRTSCVQFLHTVCLCFGFDSWRAACVDHSEALNTFWDDRKGDGPTHFGRFITKWFDQIHSRKMETDKVAGCFSNMQGYLRGQRNGLNMSYSHFKRREMGHSFMDDWWNFLCSIVHRMHLNRETALAKSLRCAVELRVDEYTFGKRKPTPLAKRTKKRRKQEEDDKEEEDEEEHTEDDDEEEDDQQKQEDDEVEEDEKKEEEEDEGQEEEESEEEEDEAGKEEESEEEKEQVVVEEEDEEGEKDGEGEDEEEESEEDGEEEEEDKEDQLMEEKDEEDGYCELVLGPDQLYQAHFIWEERATADGIRHYMEVAPDLVVSMRRESVNKSGVRLTDGLAFPKHWKDDEIEITLPAGVDRYRSVNMLMLRGLRLFELDPVVLFEFVSPQIPVTLKTNLEGLGGGGSIARYTARLSEELYGGPNKIELGEAIVEQLSMAARHLWSEHCQHYKSDNLKEFEEGPDGSWLRDVLGLQKEDLCGFQECSIEIYIPEGDVQYDSTVPQGSEEIQKPYRYTTMMASAFQDESGNPSYFFLRFFHDDMSREE